MCSKREPAAERIVGDASLPLGVQAVSYGGISTRPTLPNPRPSTKTLWVGRSRRSTWSRDAQVHPSSRNTAGKSRSEAITRVRYFLARPVVFARCAQRFSVTTILPYGIACLSSSTSLKSFACDLSCEFLSLASTIVNCVSIPAMSPVRSSRVSVQPRRGREETCVRA